MLVDELTIEMMMLHPGWELVLSTIEYHQ